MATSTLLQKLDLEVDGFGASTSNRRQVETFIAAATLTVGQWVALDLSSVPAVISTEIDDYADQTLLVRPAASDLTAGAGIESNASIVVGVVLSSAESSGTLTAGSKVYVVTRGPAIAQVDAAGVKADILAGMALMPDVTLTAGMAVAYTAASTVRPCGVALVASTTQNTIPVYVYPSMT